MELNTYARIGKDVISKAIGMQKNYKEIYEKGERKINESKSGCFNCETYNQKCMYQACGLTSDYDELHECYCQDCPSAVWDNSYKVVYINEKNRFGYQPTLKSNAIKLLLLYHFLQPDTNGFVKDVSIKELSQILDCTVATIKSSNDMLSRYGYCYIGNSGLYDNHINILLPAYKHYHKTAAEGGRGYITMPSSLMQDLLSIGKLNTLRLNIKGILEVDNASINDVKNPFISFTTASYQKLRGFLPAYCKRNVIKKALEANDSIFNLSFEETFVTFELKEQYSKKKLREEMLQEAAIDIQEYIDQVNDVIDIYNNMDIEISDREDLIKQSLSMFNINTVYSNIILTQKDYQDLASMCVQYSPLLVKNAISIAYNYYYGKHEAIENYGGLIRSIIKNKSFIQKAS